MASTPEYYEATKVYDIIENYIYIYQLGVYCILPAYPDQINDNLSSTFAQENILSRTAPIYSYSYSGPRTVQFTIDLQRDLMNAYNYDNSQFIEPLASELGEDYVDTLIRYIQAMGLPTYSASSAADTYNKMINPPMAAVRFGNEVFVKGVVNGTVGVTYSGPINAAGKYTQATITFSITETEPQDAETIAAQGSFRNLSNLITQGIYKTQ